MSLSAPKGDSAPKLALVPLDVVDGEIVPEPTATLAVVSDRALSPTPPPARLDEHAPSVYLAALSPGSRRAMKAGLECIAKLLSPHSDVYTLPWGALRFAHTQAVRAALAERFAPATANQRLSALKGTLKTAWELGQMPTEEYQRAVNVKRIRAQTLPKGRALKSRELGKMFAVCAQDQTPAGARDAGLLAVLFGTGLRRSEVVSLDLSDYDPDTGELKVRHGKGNKGRVTYAGREAREALDDYLDARGEEDGPLFLPVKRGRARRDGSRPDAVFEMRRMTDQAVADIVRKLQTRAGVEHWSPHDARRTYISERLDAGADISTVQKAVGHASVVTTARYDRRGEKAKREMAESVPLYRKRPKQGKLDL